MSWVDWLFLTASGFCGLIAVLCWPWAWRTSSRDKRKKRDIQSLPTDQLVAQVTFYRASGEHDKLPEREAELNRRGLYRDESEPGVEVWVEV